MSDPSPKAETQWEVGDFGFGEDFVVLKGTREVIADARDREIAERIVLEHNAHAALVEACENAWNWFEVDEPKSAVQVVEQIRAALAKARPGKE